MYNARHYLAGRSAAFITSDYNPFGFSDPGLVHAAIVSVANSRTPVVIGTGFMSHYPLMWGWMMRQRQEWYGIETQHYFKVNQGWGDASAWIAPNTWYCGRLSPVPNNP
jgi:hypothetical protein